jgi:chemotaxis response regulator CheB
MENLKIKIGIVDDDLLFVQLLENYINSHEGYEVVSTSTGGHHFLNETDTDLPDVLLYPKRAPELKSLYCPAFTDGLLWDKC